MYEISQFFIRYFKAYLWSIHMAKNLILAIPFGFKLNSNLKNNFCYPVVTLDRTQLSYVMIWIHFNSNIIC